MTTATFKYIDPQSYQGKPWSKVDGPGENYKLIDKERNVINLRGQQDKFSTDNCGFAVYEEPSKEKLFNDDASIRSRYYDEVEAMIKRRLKGVKKVVIFDHTIRRRQKNAPRMPVQQTHVDQTPRAAEARVRRHLPKEEAEDLLQGRYQIINVWRPIENPASDFPLGVIDWRTTSENDFVPVDLLYPKRQDEHDDDDDRGKERPPDPSSYTSTEGYEVKGETFGVSASPDHQFYYMKDMTPDEVMCLKCFDSYGQGMKMGRPGLAVRTPHTAFIDPNTRADAPGRQSVEVRCLVFYE